MKQKLIAIFLFIGILGLAGTALAKTITVKPGVVNIADDGYCSLLEALEISQGIIASNPDCTITDTTNPSFILKLSGTYALTKRYSPSYGAALPLFKKNVIIETDDTGANLVKQSGATPSTSPSHILENWGATVEFRKINFSDQTSNGEGCIKNIAGTLTLNNTSFMTCNTDLSGGAVINFATLSINNSKIIASSAADGGGALSNLAGANATIHNTLLIGNSSTSFGGTINNTGNLVLKNSSITRSSGKYGILHNVGDMTLINTTIAQNRTENGGTIVNSQAYLPELHSGQLKIYNSTITENTDDSDTAALYNANSPATSVSIYNTIIAGNTNHAECYGHLQAAEYSIIAKTNTSYCSYASYTVTRADAEAIKLVPDSNSNSQTVFYYPQNGSIAIDEGDPNGCRGPENILLVDDQRNSIRPISGNQNGISVCDIGAVEVNPCETAGCSGDKDNDDDGDGQTEVEGDCDDTNNQIASGFTEICDHLDNDCDTLVDNDAIDQKTFYLDNDSDDYGTSTTTSTACFLPDGYSVNNLDCNDNQSQVNPTQAEICGDSIDQNCDGTDISCNLVDQDNDGFTPEAGDCDDSNANKAPNKTETCDNLDNDCNGQIDDNLGQTTCGIGACTQTINNCEEGANQTCTALLPQAEICDDNIDQDCNGSDLTCENTETILNQEPTEPTDTPDSTNSSSQTDTTTNSADSGQIEDSSSNPSSGASSGGGCSLTNSEPHLGLGSLIAAYFLGTAIMRGYFLGTTRKVK